MSSSSGHKDVLIVKKRGTDIPLLQSKVVRITLSTEVVTSPRYMRKPPTLLLTMVVSHVSDYKKSITLRIVNMSCKDGVSLQFVVKLHKDSELSQCLFPFKDDFR